MYKTFAPTNQKAICKWKNKMKGIIHNLLMRMTKMSNDMFDKMYYISITLLFTIFI